MKTSYSKVLSAPRRLAVLDLIPALGVDGTKPNGLLISRINVPVMHRRRGYGQEMLDACMADADKNKITLYLWINASGDMSYQQLAAWYNRYGFTESDGLFTREPKVNT